MTVVERAVISYEKWKANRAIARARAEEIDKALPPYERTRPRDPDEARVLRGFGTPERLIGPTREE